MHRHVLNQFYAALRINKRHINPGVTVKAVLKGTKICRRRGAYAADLAWRDSQRCGFKVPAFLHLNEHRLPSAREDEVDLPTRTPPSAMFFKETEICVMTRNDFLGGLAGKV